MPVVFALYLGLRGNALEFLPPSRRNKNLCFLGFVCLLVGLFVSNITQKFMERF